MVDRAVTVFWKHGGTNTTMRVLGSELGLMPASIYNAFGSKRELLQRALRRYLDRVEDDLLEPLAVSDADPAGLIRFVDELRAWVTDAGHPGCLMVNLLSEQAQGDESLMGFAELHRNKMRAAFRPALATMDASQAEARANLLLAAVMGMSVAARSGAGRSEMADLAGALKGQIRRWASV